MEVALAYPYASNQRFPFVASFFNHLKRALTFINIDMSHNSNNANLSKIAPFYEIAPAATSAIGPATQRSQSDATQTAVFATHRSDFFGSVAPSLLQKPVAETREAGVVF